MIQLVPNIFSPKSAFTPRDIAVVQEAIATYQYGKYNIIAHPDTFNVESDGKSVSFNNFTDSMASNQGICEELAYKASKNLNKLFGDKFIFCEMGCLFAPYDMAHIAILGMGVDKIEQLKGLFSRSKNILSIIGDFKKQNSPKERKKVEALFNSTKFKLKEFAGCLLIDPSFNTVDLLHRFLPNTHDYAIIDFIPRRDFNPFLAKHKRTIPCDGSHMLPLGYARKIVPEGDFDDKTIMFICFENQNGVIQPELQTFNYDGFESQSYDYMNRTASDNPLRKFMEKLKSDLA